MSWWAWWPSWSVQGCFVAQAQGLRLNPETWQIEWVARTSWAHWMADVERPPVETCSRFVRFEALVKPHPLGQT